MTERLQRLLGSQLGVNLGGTPTDAPQVDTAEQVYISSLALLKMLKHGRAGVPMEVRRQINWKGTEEKHASTLSTLSLSLYVAVLRVFPFSFSSFLLLLSSETHFRNPRRLTKRETVFLLLLSLSLSLFFLSFFRCRLWV